MVKLNLNPTRSELRQFGFIALGAFGLLGALIYWRILPLGALLGTATPVASYVLWGLGALSALLSLVEPRANRALFVGLSVIAFPIGLVLSYVIMGSFFFLVLTPLGLLFRLVGRDVLHRRFDRAAASYWVEHKPVRDVGRYFRQY